MREINRRRALALQEAVERIEAEFGGVGELILSEFQRMPSIALKDCIFHGYPDDALANDVVLEAWEILMLLRTLHDRYADEVLGPSEAA